MRQLNHGAVDVGTSPTRLCTVPPGVDKAIVQNVGSALVFIGAEDVSVTGDRQGLMLKAGEKEEVPCYEHDATPVYAVAAQEKTARVVFLVST